MTPQNWAHEAREAMDADMANREARLQACASPTTPTMPRCYVVDDRIIYCPTHAAAPEMARLLDARLCVTKPCYPGGSHKLCAETRALLARIGG